MSICTRGWQQLRRNPGLARMAFDEAVRSQSPVQTFFRTTTTDCIIAGVPIPEGQKILMFLGAANRIRSAYSASASTSPAWRPKRS